MKIVSIRARPFGRAMLRHAIFRLRVADVSIRARPFGRAMLWPFAFLARSHTVSIRARPFGRAMHRASALGTSSGLFQSAPGLSAGRCSTLATCCFNSRTAQACANLVSAASTESSSLRSTHSNFLKNRVLQAARKARHFVVAWGSRVISTRGLRNRLSGICRTA